MKKRTRKALCLSLDNLARQICKLESNFTCARCGMSGDGNMIQWAHIEGRRKKGGMIRWSQNNCLPLCAGEMSNHCHYWFDNNKIASSEWLRKRYPDKYNWLHETINGKPRSEQLFTEGLHELIELETELKEHLKTLK